MEEYHKINSLFKREMMNGGKLIIGKWSTPEFDYLQNQEWIFTEKVDGTNIRIMFDGNAVRYGGRTENAQIPATLIDRLNDLFPISKMLDAFSSEAVCLYGEGYGHKIQNGGKYKSTQDFVLFDVNIDGVWLERQNVEDVAKKLNIEVVPIISSGTLMDGIDLAKAGFNSKWGDFISEGIVARPKVELLNRRGHRIITKIKHRDFQ